MKLPLLAVLAGLLIGIALVLWLAPATAEGAALIIFVAIVLVAFVGIAAGKVISLVIRVRAGRPPANPRRTRAPRRPKKPKSDREKHHSAKTRHQHHTR